MQIPIWLAEILQPGVVAAVPEAMELAVYFEKLVALLSQQF